MRFLKNSGYIKVDDAQLYYEEYGEGFPIVFLHGNGENMRYFDRQIPVFSKNRRIICIDSRGHGKSERGSGPLDFWHMASDVAAILDALHIFQADFLGFSDGGNIAIHFALCFPERVRSLILNGANLSPKGMKFFVRISIIFDYTFQSLCSIFSKNAKKSSEILKLMVHYPNLNPKQISKITAHSLVIVGEKDMIKNSESKNIANALQAEFCLLPNADHFCAAKQPDLFNQKVLLFLEKNS